MIWFAVLSDAADTDDVKTSMHPGVTVNDSSDSPSNGLGTAADTHNISASTRCRDCGSASLPCNIWSGQSGINSNNSIGHAFPFICRFNQPLQLKCAQAATAGRPPPRVLADFAAAATRSSWWLRRPK
jgi:hypothetical protein